MGNIKVLGEHLANQIAAGEVVERPASVVKELVENAIDAGSSKINVFIEGAGLKLIRIVDNGSGIMKEDVKNAFARHATSKLQETSDLFRINTLGFRGEALPSIASIAHVVLKTGVSNETGTHFEIKGGKVLRHEQCDGVQGTDITVSQIFFNTPARLKYLKTEATELGNILDIMNRLALSHPDIAFCVVSNGKELLKTFGNGDILQVVARIYGMEVAKKMLYVESTTPDYELQGYICLPELTRASRNYMTTLVNGRFVRSAMLSKSVIEGYHSFLTVNRYPYVLLNIKLDPQLVDVNVHPTKLDVRFSKERELQDLITNCLQDRLRNEQFMPEVVAKNLEKKQVVKQLVIDSKSQENQITQSNSGQADSNRVEETRNSYMAEKKEREVAEKGDHVSEIRALPMINEVENLNILFPENKITESVQTENEQLSTKEGTFVGEEDILDTLDAPNNKNYATFGQFAVIGQLHGTYILAQHEEGLYILDQHAVEERLNYEFFKKKLAENNKMMQPLLFPITLDFAADKIVILGDYLLLLKEIGVELEFFGSTSIILREVPVWFPKGREEIILEELLEQVLEKKKIDIGQLRDKAAIIMSCKASVRANEDLSMEEMQQLLNNLYESGAPMTCPHGRPVAVCFSKYELEKMFKRVM